MGWSSEQEAAISSRGRNILVSAAAGSGKTSVLIERIIRRVTDTEEPVDVDQFLVMTFTNAAAAEMKQRLAEALETALAARPDDENILRQLALVNRAQMTTIHAFCMELLRTHPAETGLDPDFRIGDESECLILRKEAMDDVLDAAYEGLESEETETLAAMYSAWRNDEGLASLTEKLHGYMMSFPWPWEWLEDAVKQFEDIRDGKPLEETPWFEITSKQAGLAVEAALADIDDAWHVAESEGIEPYVRTAEKDMEMLRAVAEGIQEMKYTWEGMAGFLSGISFMRLPVVRDMKDNPHAERFKALRDSAKRSIKQMSEQLEGRSRERVIQECTEMAGPLGWLAGLVKAYHQRYSELKNEKNMLDFNDLEHACLQLLVTRKSGCSLPTETALEVRRRYAEVCVDEYQDTNSVQEEILKAVSRSGNQGSNLFLVGDMKQSIYRFRQANPALFAARRDSYRQPGSEGLLLLLRNNFRSGEHILEATNHLFRRLMSQTAGEMVYSEDEALVYPHERAVEGLPGVVLEVLDTRLPETSAGDEEPAEKAVLEARRLGVHIRELVDGRRMIYDKSRKITREIRYSDIVILMRSVKGWGDVFTDTLRGMDIPVFSDTGDGYLASSEVGFVLALLAVIDNPLQDIQLATVLRFPVIGFTDDDLAGIRNGCPEGFFWRAFRQMAGELSELGERCRVFADRLDRWRQLSGRMPVEQLLAVLDQEMDLMAFVAGLPGGETRLANLRILVEKAAAFEKSSMKGLFSFVRMMEKLRISGGDFGSARVLGENDNVVRLMSIHKSKGLEFPVVMVAGLGRRFNQMDASGRLLMHRHLGFGPDLIRVGQRSVSDTLAKRSVAWQERTESLSEEMRVLYVAMTRAREHLYLIGCSGNSERALQKWESTCGRGQALLPHRVLAAQCFLDWIVPAVLMEKGKRWFSMSVISPDHTGSAHEAPDMRQVMSELMADIQAVPLESRTVVEVKRRMEWSRGRKISAVPAKISVSELKRMYRIESEEDADTMFRESASFDCPAFLRDESLQTLTGADIGKLYHMAFQTMPPTPDPSEAAKWLQNQVLSGRIQPDMAAVIKPSVLAAFYRSLPGEKILRADRVLREAPFTLPVPADKLLTDAGKDMVLLQGVLDLAAELPEGWILVDFKTDRIPETGGTDAIVSRYRFQLEAYAEALSAMTGKPVQEKWIYLVFAGASLEV